MEEKQPQLRILVAGRPQSLGDWCYWQRTFSKPVRLLLAVLGVAMGVFALEAMVSAVQTGDIAYILLAFLVVIAAAIRLIVTVVVWDKETENTAQSAWYDRHADRKAEESGSILAFYDNCVVNTTVRGASTLYYSQIVQYRETPAGIALLSRTGVILITGKDLTAYDLDLIRSFLTARIPSASVRIKGRTIPYLTEPLPIPRLTNDDIVLARAELSYRALHRSQAKKQQKKRRMGLLLPGMAVCAAAMTALVPFSLPYIGSLMVYLVVFIGGGLLLEWFFSRSVKKTVETDFPVSLAFTKEGLAVNGGGFSGFIVKDRLRTATGRTGVTVEKSDGTRMEIPYSAFDDPDNIRRILN